MPYTCDRCDNPGAYMVGVIDTGEQLVLCTDHLAAPTGVDAPASAPGVCELCEAEPAVVMQRALTDGSKMYMCGRCLLLTGHMAYLNAPDELREQVDEMAGGGELVSTGGRAGRRRRSRRLAADELAVVSNGGDDAARVENGLAASDDGEASPAAATDPAEGEPVDGSALEPHSVLDHPDAGAGL